MDITLMTIEELHNAIEDYQRWIKQKESLLNRVDVRIESVFRGNISHYQNQINDIKNELKRRYR